MGILIDEHTQVIVQGMTGHFGSLHAKQCLEYGTQIVAGVVPSKGGQYCLDKPIYDTVAEAVLHHKVDATMIMVPKQHAKEAIIEAIFAYVPLIICITEGIPVWDMMEIKQMLAESKSKLIGPNCPGVITPGKAKIGIMPPNLYTPGSLGLVSRSGTLSYEAVSQLSSYGVGQSTCVGIGGDPIIGMNFIDVIKLFEKDEATKAILLLGEIGGVLEQEAAKWIKRYCKKPVFAYIGGKCAPKEKKMGHAGAMISSNQSLALSKITALTEANVTMIDHVSMIGKQLETQK